KQPLPTRTSFFTVFVGCVANDIDSKKQRKSRKTNTKKTFQTENRMKQSTTQKGYTMVPLTCQHGERQLHGFHGKLSVFC
ncbi:MAG: hypothetical protein RR989_06330, partial [Ruthenibacterium sp.]